MIVTLQDIQEAARLLAPTLPRTPCAGSRTLSEIAAHRFVYRPEDSAPFVDFVERRSMEQHVEKLIQAGRVEEVEPRRYRRV